MKKNGFTLAEVLITLAIIGVVATLTLPALMTNTAEQQAKTSLKKGINTLTEAAQMNQAIAGFDYGSLTVAMDAADPNPDEQSLYGLLATRTSVDYQKSGTEKLVTNNNGTATSTPSANYALFFRDGSALMFDPAIVSSSAADAPGDGSQAGDKLMDDNLVYGITAIYDTNGAKGPNILSNCKGAALGAAPDASDIAECTGAKRIIKDQFGVRLRGGFAVPNGAAARWAFEN